MQRSSTCQTMTVSDTMLEYLKGKHLSKFLGANVNFLFSFSLQHSANCACFQHEGSKKKPWKSEVFSEIIVGFSFICNLYLFPLFNGSCLFNWKCRIAWAHVILSRIIYLKKGRPEATGDNWWATVATFEVNSGLYELTVIIAMSLLHIQWYIWFSSGFSDKNEKFNLYDVIIFGAHWVMCMSFMSYDISTLLPRHSSFTLTSDLFQVGKFKCLFLLLKLHNVDQKCIGWCYVTRHVFTFLFSQWCNGSKGGNLQCVAIESTFSKVALLGILKARSYYFPFCLTLLQFYSFQPFSQHNLSLSETPTVPVLNDVIFKHWPLNQLLLFTIGVMF